MELSSENGISIELQQSSLVLFNQLPSFMPSALLTTLLFDEVCRLDFLLNNRMPMFLFQLSLQLFELLHANLPGTLQDDLLWRPSLKGFYLLSFWFPIKRYM
jgi:hypothetical protein